MGVYITAWEGFHNKESREAAQKFYDAKCYDLHARICERDGYDGSIHLYDENDDDEKVNIFFTIGEGATFEDDYSILDVSIMCLLDGYPDGYILLDDYKCDYEKAVSEYKRLTDSIIRPFK